MQYIATIKRKWRKPKQVVICAEDQEWAYKNLWSEYPKHKILNLK